MTESLPLAGTAVHLRHMGTGAIPVLILHCGQGSGGMWRPVTEALSHRLRVLAPDFPGHGRSGPWPEGRDVQDVAVEIAHALLPDGAHVVGHSFGATVALRLAMETTRRVRSLTLVEPVLFAAAAGTPDHAQQRAEDREYTARGAAGNWPGAARAFNRQWGGVPWEDLSPQAQARMAEAMRFILASRTALWEDPAGLLSPGRLEGLDLPVHLLRGANTRPVVAAIHAGLARRLPDARETVVPDAGHMLPVTHPEAMIRALDASTAG